MPRYALALLLALFLVSGADAQNWARFRGPNGNGIATGQEIPVKFDEKEGIAWKVPIVGTGNSGPIIWGDHMFLQTATPDAKQRLVLCLDVKTGKELWSRSTPAKKAPTHAKSSLASPSAATDGEAVYIPIWDGQDLLMTAYDFKGNVLWVRNLGVFVSQHGAGVSPILYKDTVILINDMDKEDSRSKKPVDRPSILYAFDKKTGATRWEAPREAVRACYTPPFLWERDGQPTELIVTSTSAITSYNPDSGSENWHWNWSFAKGKLRTIAATYIIGDMLYATSGDGGGDRQMFALHLQGSGKNTNPRTVWSNEKDFPYVPCSITWNNHIYFVNDRGFAGCFEPKTGKRVWLERLPEATFCSSPVLIDGKVYAASEQGNVYVFAAETSFQLLATNSLGETIRASSAVADGRLFVRGQNHLFCISKKK